MVGDDILSDIKGAKDYGLKAIQPERIISRHNIRTWKKSKKFWKV